MINKTIVNGILGADKVKSKADAKAVVERAIKLNYSLKELSDFISDAYNGWNILPNYKRLKLEAPYNAYQVSNICYFAKMYNK